MTTKTDRQSLNDSTNFKNCYRIWSFHECFGNSKTLLSRCGKDDIRTNLDNEQIPQIPMKFPC